MGCCQLIKERPETLKSIGKRQQQHEESEANTKDQENPQDHRPGLSRKRAKFSLKSDTCQPSTIMEPSFQINQLLDPNEFFADYEKFESTRKETKRHTVGEELNEAKNPTTARHPRS